MDGPSAVFSGLPGAGSAESGRLGPRDWLAEPGRCSPALGAPCCPGLSCSDRIPSQGNLISHDSWARRGSPWPPLPTSQEALLPPTSVQPPLPMVTSPAGPPVRGTDFISPLTRSQLEAQRPLDSDGPDQMPPRCPLPSDPPNLAPRVPLSPSGYHGKTQADGGVITGHEVHPLKGTIQRFSVRLLSCAPTIRVWTLPVPRGVSLPLVLSPPSSPDYRQPCSVSTHRVPSSGRSA